MIVVDERDIIDALNRATDEDMVRDLILRIGRESLLEQGFHLIADEPSSFTDAGAAPQTWLDTALQARPGDLSSGNQPSDAGGNLDGVKPRSEGIARSNGS